MEIDVTDGEERVEQMDDERIVKWHVTDEGELDYTIYKEVDGGRLHLKAEPKIGDVYKALAGLLE